MTLTCTADEANPTSQITWYRDDDPVTEGVVKYEEEGDYNSYISISFLTWTAQREDNGVIYSCEVDGTDLQDEHKMNVTCEWCQVVLYIPSVIVILSQIVTNLYPYFCLFQMYSFEIQRS